MFCSNCGNKLNGDTKFCEKCGKALSTNSNENVKVSKSGNSTLKALGLASIILGPITAIVLAFSTYWNTYNRRMSNPNFGRNSAQAHYIADNALTNALPILVLVFFGSVVLGIIFLVISRKNK